MHGGGTDSVYSCFNSSKSRCAKLPRIHDLENSFSHPTSFRYATVPHGVAFLEGHVAGTLCYAQGQAKC